MGVESETPEVACFVSQQHACHSCGVTSLHFINPGQRGYERKREGRRGSLTCTGAGSQDLCGREHVGQQVSGRISGRMQVAFQTCFQENQLKEWLQQAPNKGGGGDSLCSGSLAVSKRQTHG